MNAEYIHTVAEAIRKNGLKQTYNVWARYDDDMVTPIAACAIGQAAINLHENSPSYVRDNLDDAYEEFVQCPATSSCFIRDVSRWSGNLGDAVIHLNDWHKWKFSSIANWMDKVANNG